MNIKLTGVISLIIMSIYTASGWSWTETGSPHIQPADTSGFNTATGGTYNYTFVGGGDVDMFHPLRTTVLYYTTESGSSISTFKQATSDQHHERYPDCFTGGTNQPPVHYYSGLAYTNAKTNTENLYNSHGSTTTDYYNGTGWSASITHGTYSYVEGDTSDCDLQHIGSAWGAWYQVSLSWSAGAEDLPALSSVGNVGGTFVDTAYVTVRTISDASDNYSGGVQNGTYRITRCGGDLSSALTVYFSFDGTATYSTDYSASPYSDHVVISAGNTTADVSIVPDYDPSDGDEFILLYIDDDANYNVGYQTPCDPTGSNFSLMWIYND